MCNHMQVILTEDEMLVARENTSDKTSGQNGAYIRNFITFPYCFHRTASKFDLEQSLLCTTVLYFMITESNPVEDEGKKKTKPPQSSSSRAKNLSLKT